MKRDAIKRTDSSVSAAFNNVQNNGAEITLSVSFGGTRDRGI